MCILIFDVKVKETNFVLVNLFDPNTETEQVTIFLDLGKMLEAIKDFYDEHKVLVGNIYFYFWHILGFIQRQTNSEKVISSQIC